MSKTNFNFPKDIQTNRYEDDVFSVLAQLKRRNLPEAPIAFYGSSSFRFWLNMATDLESLDIVNLGFGGGTNASGLHYFDTLLTPLKPSKVVLYFGENDISNDGLSAATTMRNFIALHAQIMTHLPDVPVYFLSAKQSPTKWIFSDEVAHFNELAAAYCVDNPSIQYIDVTSILLGENGRPMMRYYIEDGIHLNGAGYAEWAGIIRSETDLLSTA